MPPEIPLIRPVASARAPQLGPVAIMAASQGDLEAIAGNIGAGNWQRHSLYMSKVLYLADSPDMPALVGPIIGAPYAAMILELIIAWGVRQVVFVGWCGSLCADVRIGEIVVPTGAWPDDGTSKHYHICRPGPVKADGAMAALVTKVLDERRLPYKQGLIWTTDGVFREVPSRIALFKKRAAVAVEMEVAALLAVAGFRKISLGALLVVSDELFQMKWHPGFKHRRFRQTRMSVGQAALAVCREISHGRC